MSLALVPIPLDKLEETRGHWFPFVASIAKRQRCFVEQRLADVYSGNVALVLVWDTEKREARALAGYSILSRGPDRIFKFVWLTGIRSADWIELYSELEKHARALGCSGMVALARPGWSKNLKNWGYRLAHVEFEKDFLDG